jgi:hypothetical protein
MDKQKHCLRFRITTLYIDNIAHTPEAGEVRLVHGHVLVHSDAPIPQNARTLATAMHAPASTRGTPSSSVIPDPQSSAVPSTTDGRRPKSSVLVTSARLLKQKAVSVSWPAPGQGCFGWPFIHVPTRPSYALWRKTCHAHTAA